MALYANPWTVTEGVVGAAQGLMARVVSPDGTGALVPNEGYAIKPADVATIACTVYDPDSLTPGVPVAQPTISSSAILSSLTIANNWGLKDQIGCNFVFTVPGTAFAVDNHTFKIVFEITTTGGTPMKWYHLHSTLPKAPK